MRREGRRVLPCRPTVRPTETGLSLLELMIVLSLVGLFVASVFESVIVTLRAVNAADERADIRQQVTHALELLTREVSLASNVDVAEDQRLQIDADLDGDGATESDILYRVQDGDLQRVYNGTAITLVRDLSSLDFDYLDLNAAALTAPVTGASLDILKVVQISLTSALDAESVSLASAAFLRNND